MQMPFDSVDGVRVGHMARFLYRLINKAKPNYYSL